MKIFHSDRRKSELLVVLSTVLLLMVSMMMPLIIPSVSHGFDYSGGLKKLAPPVSLYIDLANHVGGPEKLVEIYYDSPMKKTLLRRLDQLGENFRVLAADPGLVIRIEEFERFIKNPRNKNLIAGKNPWIVREEFKKFLGKRVLYRGLNLQPEVVKKMISDGMSPIEPFQSVKDFQENFCTRVNPESVGSELCEKYVIGGAKAILYERFMGGGEENFSQSLTAYRDAALVFAHQKMHENRLAAKARYQLQHKGVQVVPPEIIDYRNYVFEIELDELDLSYFREGLFKDPRTRGSGDVFQAILYFRSHEKLREFPHQNRTDSFCAISENHDQKIETFFFLTIPSFAIREVYEVDVNEIWDTEFEWGKVQFKEKSCPADGLESWGLIKFQPVRRSFQD